MPVEVYVDNLRTSKDQKEPTILEFDTRPIVGDFLALDLGEGEVRTYRVRKVWHHFFRPDDESFAVSAGLSDGQTIIDIEEVHSMSEAPNVYEVPTRNGSAQEPGGGR